MLQIHVQLYMCVVLQQHNKVHVQTNMSETGKHRTSTHQLQKMYLESTILQFLIHDRSQHVNIFSMRKLSTYETRPKFQILLQIHSNFSSTEQVVETLTSPPFTHNSLKCRRSNTQVKKTSTL